MRPLGPAIVFITATCLACRACAQANNVKPAEEPNRKLNQIDTANKATLEPRVNNFVKDIVDRLHALDADIGKLVYNSTSMYSPDESSLAGQLESAGEKAGGQKFTEVLSDLDSLQDEIGQMITNTTRNRQYNILVRLRPLNVLLYRIRHNLHLMRNSLVAINTVSTLERLGNSVLDSTLTAFMRPDADLNEEIGDNGNYDINLDKPEVVKNNQEESRTTSQAPNVTTTVTISPPTNSSSAALVAQTPTQPPKTSPKPSTVAPTTPKPTTPASTTLARVSTTPTPTTDKADQSTTRRTRRPIRNRANQRRNSTTSTTTTTSTQKPTNSLFSV